VIVSLAACAPAVPEEAFFEAFDDRWCEAAAACGAACEPAPWPIVELWEYDGRAARDCLREEWGCGAGGAPAPPEACSDVVVAGDAPPWWEVWLQQVGGA
jgi:hypothetical protein